MMLDAGSGHDAVRHCDTLNSRIRDLHQELRAYLPAVDRIAVCLHDAPTGDVSTFLYSPSDTPLRNYRVNLAEAPALEAMRQARKPRVVDDLLSTYAGFAEHSVKLRDSGFHASYTVPMYDGDCFVGFMFFNSRQVGVFSPLILRHLDLVVWLIGLMIESSLRSLTMLTGSLSVLRDVAHLRDDETARHLTRMAQYSAIIARGYAQESGHDDEWVEQVHRFAPLHDIGKIAVPDSLLLKPGELTAEEFRAIQQHTVHGAELLGGLVEKLGLDGVPYVQALLDIARHHHECWDGSGYPDHLRGEAIPLEARIVKVADVFDALTTRRRYKGAWPLERALQYLENGCGTMFDRRCVEVFKSGLPAVLDIMARFQDTSAPDYE